MNLEDRLKEYNGILDDIIDGMNQIEPADEEEQKIKQALVEATKWFKEIATEKEVTEEFISMLTWALKLGATHNAIMVASQASIIVIHDLGDNKFTEFMGDKDDESIH